MRRTLVSGARPVAAAVALLLGLTLAAPPAVAAEAPPAAAKARPRMLTAATAAKLANLDTSRAVRAAQDPGAPATASDEPRSFFRSGRGVAVLALLAVGVGYTIYSTKADDVKRSPHR